MDRNDTILCKDKNDAYEHIKEIGIKHISDWEFFRDGSVKIFLNCKLDDLKEEGC